MNSGWTSEKMTKELKKLDFVEVKKLKNKNYFAIKGNHPIHNLFD